jgi:hypothetical protein
MLPRHSGDPDVVLWDGSAYPCEFGFNLAILLGGVLIGQQQRGDSQEFANLRERIIAPRRSLSAKVEFAKHHQGHIQNRNGRELRTQTNIAADVVDDHAGVQEDTTSPVHRSSRNTAVRLEVEKNQLVASIGRIVLEVGCLKCL